MLLRIMTTKIQIVVDEAGIGQRLDHYLAARPELAAESLSRTRIQGLIESGLVWLDETPALQTKTKLRAGQIVEVEVPEPAPAAPQGEAIPLHIVF
jgi:23S rRNA pseudouridine1911/1915/1917 synthase